MRTERGLDRFVTFLDAVVAIAITLLVLPLVDVLGGTCRPGSGQRVLRRGRQVWHVLPEPRPDRAALARPSPHRRGRRRLRRLIPWWPTWPGASRSCWFRSPPRGPAASRRSRWRSWSTQGR